MRAANLKLNREAQFVDLMIIQAQRPNGATTLRTYHIVKQEGYMAFLRELCAP
jgi:hypothetical protein